MSTSIIDNTRRLNAYQRLQQQRLDEVNVVNLRAYASRLWARYPYMPEQTVRDEMHEESLRRDYTERELRAACLNLRLVRDDEPAPTTLRAVTP